MKTSHPLIPKNPIDTGYSRTGQAEIVFKKCDFTEVETWCVSVDGSDGEYKEVNISIEFLNQQLEIAKNGQDK